MRLRTKHATSAVVVTILSRNKPYRKKPSPTWYYFVNSWLSISNVSQEIYNIGRQMGNGYTKNTCYLASSNTISITFIQTWVHSRMPIQNNFPSIGFELLPNIRRANISWDYMLLIVGCCRLYVAHHIREEINHVTVSAFIPKRSSNYDGALLKVP